MMSVEAKFNQALETISFYERLIVNLRAALHKERLFNTQVEMETKIAGLPTDAKERLRRAFPGIDLGGLRQAVNVEKRGAR